jgi:uncharacterized protein
LASDLTTQQPENLLDCGSTESSLESSTAGGRRARLAMAVGLVIAYSLPISAFLRPTADLLVSLTSISDVSAWTVGVVAQQLSLVLLILAIVHFWERRPFCSVGFQRVSLADVSAAVVMWLVSECVEVPMKHLPAFFSPSLAVHPSQNSFHLMLVSFPEWSRISLIVGNSFAEEVGRAYTIERLTEATGSLYAAALLALLFSLGAHALYGGFDNMLVYLPGQLSFVLLYLWRRNTITCVLSHTLANGFGLIVWYHLPVSVNHLLHRLGF